MIFLDVNTFFGDKGGGIRTYHLAKIAWFRKHPEHRYVVVGPGAENGREELAPNVLRVRIKGPRATKDPAGYRLLLDAKALRALVDEFRPDVVESGDPWLGGPMLLRMRRKGARIPVLSSFYHGDPVRTYIDPWASRGATSFARRPLAKLAGKAFYGLQRKYDVTLVSSREMERHLREMRVPAALTPFGCPAEFLERGKTHLRKGGRRRNPGAPLRLLYAGRLDPEKGTDLLARAVPKLLDWGNVSVTVLGRGSREAVFRNEEWLANPNYRAVGYIADRSELLDVIDGHDVLLSLCPWETFGLGVLECFALGIPAVAPAKGGAGELVAELAPEALYAPDDLDGLLDALLRVMDMDYGKLSAKALEVAARYGSWDDACARMAAFYGRRIPEAKR